MKQEKEHKTCDYSHKIPSLPYKEGNKADEKYPSDQKPPRDPGCANEPGKRPEPFDGIEGRHKEPERQHYPFLTIHIDFIGQRETIRNGGDVIVSVTNNGNGVAFTPFVELIESAYNGLFVEPANPALFERRGFKMLSPLYPHQTRTVLVKWSRLNHAGRIVGICYDPLLDKRPKVPYKPWNLPEFHRKITSIHWSRME